jgi:regulator of nonsense transcripts 1
MDAFDNFQYDSSSSYGGMGIVDDTSSVYTSTTQNDGPALYLESLSLSDDRSQISSPQNDRQHVPNGSLSEDFDAVLDDLKDEGAVDLPPHACWCVTCLPSLSFLACALKSYILATVAFITPLLS